MQTETPVSLDDLLFPEDLESSKRPVIPALQGA